MPFPLWKVLKNLIGQELSKVSLPVGMNEPLCALQKNYEMVNTGERILRAAAETDDAAKRAALTAIATNSSFYLSQWRKKKFFNPMLGETYEMVMEHCRFVAEKVAHTPEQILAYRMEGEHYYTESYDKPQIKLGFGGGRGMVNLAPKGYTETYYKKYDDFISASKPVILVRNVFIGPLAIDFDKTVTCISHKTGAKATYTLHPKSGNVRSHVTGASYDKDGRKKYEIEGSWLDQVRLRNCETNEMELIWEAPALEPDAHLQFFFSQDTCLLNYQCPEMVGLVAPTDSRFRMDMRFME